MTYSMLVRFTIVDENAASGHSDLLVDNIRVESISVEKVPEPSMIAGLFSVLSFAYLKKRQGNKSAQKQSV